MSELIYHAENWFREAARCYVENHQGCPWCHEANGVYQSARNGVTEYRCGNCEFLACHDQAAGRYYMGPGREHEAPTTMFAFHEFLSENPSAK